MTTYANKTQVVPGWRGVRKGREPVLRASPDRRCALRQFGVHIAMSIAKAYDVAYVRFRAPDSEDAALLHDSDVDATPEGKPIAVMRERGGARSSAPAGSGFIAWDMVCDRADPERLTRAATAKRSMRAGAVRRPAHRSDDFISSVAARPRRAGRSACRPGAVEPRANIRIARFRR